MSVGHNPAATLYPVAGTTLQICHFKHMVTRPVSPKSWLMP